VKGDQSMIDEGKVLRMTRMASYEKRGGRKDKAVAKYFKGDYVGMHLLVSFLAITGAFVAVIAAYICFSFEEVMASLYTMNLLEIGKKCLFYYVIALVVYLVITYVIYQQRYKKSRKRLERFVDYLDSLEPEEDS